MQEIHMQKGYTCKGCTPGMARSTPSSTSANPILTGLGGGGGGGTPSGGGSGGTLSGGGGPTSGGGGGNLVTWKDKEKIHL